LKNETVEEITKKVTPILKRFGVTKAALFGSTVRGQAKRGSDVDILVKIDADISLLDFVGLKLELEEALGRKVDVVEYDVIKPLLREEILREQVVIL
jgi:hypothetical protein